MAPLSVEIVHTSPASVHSLDVLIIRGITVFNNSSSWGEFIRTIRGQGDIHPDVGNIPHPVSLLLAHFGKEGTPASMSDPPWNPARIANALARGPHQSSHQGIEFFLIQDVLGLGVSPMGMVNQDTIPLAPAEAMQFDHTLPRLVTQLHRANTRFGTVYMFKLKPDNTMRLGVLFPSRKGKPPLIGIPLTNPMGWKSSPPNFSTRSGPPDAASSSPYCLQAAPTPS
eukprot:jgi/Psemu1/338/gm1.338_g